ncbi:MAG: UbiA family prenyltransferase, partial [Nitrospinota bacterium]
SPDQVNTLPPMERVCVVGQTTLNKKRYFEIANVVKQRFPDSVIEETICSATDERQEEVLILAGEVEAVVVVGGKNSANTNHLAHLSSSTGTPTFHIEKEDELDEKAISAFNSVGVTAGASTPTWMINRVVDRLEKMGRSRSNKASRFISAVTDFTVNSNLYISTGAALLSFITPAICGFALNPLSPFVSFFYFFSMYSLNQLGDREEFGLKKPGRIHFFEEYKGFMLSSGFASMFLALLLSSLLGTIPFLIVLISTLLGIAYSVKIFPRIASRKMEIRRLKDIPASKDLFVGIAWAAVTVLVPAFSFAGSKLTIPVAVTFCFVFMISYIRSVLFDIRDIQGDRFVGRETIPIIIGLEPTKIFLLVLSGLTAICLAAMTLLGYVPAIGFFLLIPVIYTVFYLFLYHRRIISQGILCDYVVDGTFILTGLVGIFHQSAPI